MYVMSTNNSVRYQPRAVISKRMTEDLGKPVTVRAQGSQVVFEGKGWDIHSLPHRVILESYASSFTTTA